MVKVLAVCTAAASLLFIAEGILVGWFLSHLIPGLEPLEGMTTRYFDSFLSEAPYVRLPTYLATACLIMIGVAGLIAAFSLLGASRPAAYFTVALVVGLFVTGAVLLVQVIWTNSTLTTVLDRSTWGRARRWRCSSASAGTPWTRSAFTANPTDPRLEFHS